MDGEMFKNGFLNGEDAVKEEMENLRIIFMTRKGFSSVFAKQKCCCPVFCTLFYHLQVDTENHRSSKQPAPKRLLLLPVVVETFPVTV